MFLCAFILMTTMFVIVTNKLYSTKLLLLLLPLLQQFVETTQAKLSNILLKDSTVRQHTIVRQSIPYIDNAVMKQAATSIRRNTSYGGVVYRQKLMLGENDEIGVTTGDGVEQFI